MSRTCRVLECSSICLVKQDYLKPLPVSWDENTLRVFPVASVELQEVSASIHRMIPRCSGRPNQEIPAWLTGSSWKYQAVFLELNLDLCFHFLRLYSLNKLLVKKKGLSPPRWAATSLTEKSRQHSGSVVSIAASQLRIHIKWKKSDM